MPIVITVMSIIINKVDLYMVIIKIVIIYFSITDVIRTIFMLLNFIIISIVDIFIIYFIVIIFVDNIDIIDFIGIIVIIIIIIIINIIIIDVIIVIIDIIVIFIIIIIIIIICFHLMVHKNTIHPNKIRIILLVLNFKIKINYVFNYQSFIWDHINIINFITIAIIIIITNHIHGLGLIIRRII